MPRVAALQKTKYWAAMLSDPKGSSCWRTMSRSAVSNSGADGRTISSSAPQWSAASRMKVSSEYSGEGGT